MRSLIAATLLFATSLVAGEILTQMDKKVLSYEEQKVNSNPEIKIHDVGIGFKKEFKGDWTGYSFNIDVTRAGKRFVAKDIVFSDGKYAVSDARDINTGKSLKDMMKPSLDSRYYKDEYRIAGKKDAKHKVVVFSDPLCPACTGFMPNFLSEFMIKKGDVAVYYIHLPLQMHPTASILTRAGMKAHEDGIKDVEYKTYTAGFGNRFNVNSNRDEQLALDVFNKALGTKYTIKQLSEKKYIENEKKHMSLAMDAMIGGTPTVYFDGVVDSSRSAHRKYLK